MTHDVGFHMPHTTHGATDRLGITPQPKVAQGAPDPFDFQNQGGGHGGGNCVNIAANKTNHQYGHPQPREASSIELQLAQITHGFTTLDAKRNAAVWKIAQGEILKRLFISSERLAARGILLTGRMALAIVFDCYGEDQRTTFLHGWEDLNDLRCRSDAELSHFWTTWQYLMWSMGEKVPEHLLLEFLWTKDEWLHFKRIRVDNVQRHRSEIQASFRSRGLALPAGVIDDGGADSELNTLPSDNGGVEHDVLDLLDDDLLQCMLYQVSRAGRGGEAEQMVE
eukprot:6368367-Amphidinium_carterae.1